MLGRFCSVNGLATIEFCLLTEIRKMHSNARVCMCVCVCDTVCVYIRTLYALQFEIYITTTNM